jgi:hypothetical protein
MRTVILAALLLLTTPFAAVSQAEQPKTVSQTTVSESDTDKAQPDISAPQSPSQPQANGYVRPDAKTRQKRFVNSLVGPMALAKNVAWAGIGTWRNSPEEWGPHWEGFGRRVASNFGKNAIKQTTIYGLDEAFKLDSHFYRSENKSVGARIKNALISPVTARKPNGKRVIGFPRIVGTYTSSIVAAETWYPSRFDYQDGLKSGTMSLGMNAVFNLVKEFIWKK